MLFHIPIDRRDFEMAAEQRNRINQKVEKTSELKNLLPQLETMYEVRVRRRAGEGMPKLSPEIEEILWRIMGKDFGKA